MQTQKTVANRAIERENERYSWSLFVLFGFQPQNTIQGILVCPWTVWLKISPFVFVSNR